jgi:hypothetical protein
VTTNCSRKEGRQKLCLVLTAVPVPLSTLYFLIRLVAQICFDIPDDWSIPTSARRGNRLTRRTHGIHPGHDGRTDKLLIEKGVITDAEFLQELLEERAAYQRILKPTPQ